MQGSIFDSFVHSLALTVCPRMPWEGESVLDSVFFANLIENMQQSSAVPSMIRELNTVVRQNFMNFVRNLLNQVFQKLSSLHFSLFFK